MSQGIMTVLLRVPFIFAFCRQTLPPVRNQTKRKKKRKQEPALDEEKKDDKHKGGTRISSYDYRSWDKFDVVSCFIKCSQNSYAL